MKQNREAILAQLAIIEKTERLEEVRQKLTFDHHTPGTSLLQPKTPHQFQLRRPPRHTPQPRRSGAPYGPKTGDNRTNNWNTNATAQVLTHITT